MTPPQQQVVHLQPRSSAISHKVQLIFKLFVLENAKRALEHNLNDFTNKAYDEVQAFFNSSFPTSGFIDLANALDAKCQVVDRLSALLKDLTAEPEDCVQQAVKIKVRTNQLQPLGDKGILMTDVLKFGPMLQNGLMASSIAKAVQVLGGTLSHQQLKHFLISQPAAAQEDNMISSISCIQTSSPMCQLKGKEKEQTVTSEEKSQPNIVSLLPAIIQTPEITAERPPLLVPASIQAIFPKISNSESMNVTPQMSWKQEDVQLQHQKQTSSQLLHFLRAKAKNMGALDEVTVMDWNKSMHSCLPQSSPTIKTHNYQFRNIVLDDLGSPARKTLRADIENEAPVFRVKQVELSGSLTYTCVIATKAELWDIGDIFTEVQQAHTVSSPVKNEGCKNMAAHVENSCVNIQRKTQTSKCTEPERENTSAGAKTPVIDKVTIPKFQARRFEEIEVVVSHAVSPGNFYIQHADSFTKLQGLITDSWKASRSYAEQNCIPDIGTQVMGWFAKREQWRRAQVTKICGVSGEDNNSTDGPGCETSIQVEVKWLDQGDTACLSLLNIKRLTAEMADLPLQALQVSLANVTPVNGRDWSEEAVGWFKAMVHNRTFYARLYPAGPKVTVELFLEKGKLGAMRRSAPVSLRLAQNGHAQHTNLKNFGVRKRTVAMRSVKTVVI